MPSDRARGATLIALTLVCCADQPTALADKGPKPSPRAKPDAGPAPSCPVCSTPKTVGKIGSKKIKEPSGIVASAIHDNVFYVHNDSGDRARFFAIDLAGKRLATFKLLGAENIDWEDVARSPCPAGSCLYFGDIGDSGGARESYSIYRVPEPKDPRKRGQRLVPETIRFRYPDEPPNAETLLVHPTTGLITIVTKVKEGPASIFEVPNETGHTSVAKKTGELSLSGEDPRITGGDVDPKGTGVLLRTSSDVFYFPLKSTETIAQALSRPPCKLIAPEEKQGESIGWLRSGRGYVTMSEKKKAELHLSECR